MRAVGVLILILVLVLATPAGATTLVAHWAFDEGSGTSAADSAGTHTGTLVSSPTWTTGRYGGGLDTSGGYVSVAHAADLGNFSQMSLAMWVYSRQWTGDPVPISKDGNSGYYWQRYSGTSRLGIWVGSGERGHVGNPTLDAWHHIAWTWDGSTFTPYLDGVAQTTVAYTGTIDPSATGALLIGAYTGGALGLNGIVDDVAIWSGALSGAEITAVMNGSLGVPEPGSAVALAVLAVGLAVRRGGRRRPCS